MADALGDAVLDGGLNVLDTASTGIYLCSAEPTTYTEATSTFALGNKIFGAGGCFGSPAAGTPNGRQVSSVAITDGAVTANGTATKWAVVTSGSSRLDAHGTLASGIAVTSGQQFTLGSFIVTIPNQ